MPKVSAPEAKQEYQTVRVPLSPLYWDTAYDGGGDVSYQDGGIRFRPAVIKRDDETRAALILLREVPPDTLGIQVRYKVLRQLRPGPRPWEVLWLFFGYRSGVEARTKTIDYFVLKTNGLEIGRAFGETEQEFLVTKEVPKLFIGRRHEIRLQFEEGDFHFLVDGRSAARSPEDFAVTRLYSGPSRAFTSFGLYAEDAEIQIDSVEILQKANALRISPGQDSTVPSDSDRVRE